MAFSTNQISKIEIFKLNVFFLGGGGCSEILGKKLQSICRLGFKTKKFKARH